MISTSSSPTGRRRASCGVLRQTSPRLHLVIGSRHEVPFPIERIRAQGDVAEFGPPDLAFTPADVDWLLRRPGSAGTPIR